MNVSHLFATLEKKEKPMNMIRKGYVGDSNHTIVISYHISHCHSYYISNSTSEIQYARCTQQGCWMDQSKGIEQK